MKISFFLACAFMLILSACTKSDVQPVTNNLSASSQDLSKATKTAFDILTAHQWMYNAFFMHYVDKNHKGDSLYVRGFTNNENNILKTDRFTFKNDNTFTQTEGKYTYPGTWSFSDSSASVLIMQYSWGTDENHIINLSRIV